MACLILLSLTEIKLSPTIFGNDCLGSKEPNCTVALPIIPRPMDKLKLSTSVWKHIFGVLHMKDKISGLSGYP
jgi:hypothetical protein